MRIPAVGGGQAESDPSRGTPPGLPLLNQAEPSTAIVRQRPQVPPKPQIDIVRYSMANAKDDLDLDTILSELLELENQLSSEASDHFLLHGLSSTASNKLSSSQRPPAYASSMHSPVNLSSSSATISARNAQSNNSLLQCGSSENDLATTTSRLPTTLDASGDLCASSDVDSAFGDSSSTECSSGSGVSGGCTNRCRISEISSADSYRGSLNTPSPTHTHQASPTSGVSVTDVSSCTIRAPSALSSSNSGGGGDVKAQKIREALEKMKEAKMKKIYVKIFLEDETTKGLLIDERWTVGETMRQLADKLKVVLTPEHALLEEYPDLHIKRIYEDHEFVVENIEDWLADSSNKLHFLRLPDKYSFVRNPQDFLLSEKSKNFENFPSPQAEWSSEAKQSLLKTFLDSNAVVPELEGWLMLKADGKKCWKKHYFVLRSSGLYYYPKSNKLMRGTKDLQCLMNVYNNQIYTCKDWTKKYKSPTNFGFAIKHPRIQVKTSKYIKYICAEDEKTFHKWVAALRITRNGFQVLYKNYSSLTESTRTSPSSLPIRVEVPQISLQRLSSLDQSVLSTPCSLSSKTSSSLANVNGGVGDNCSSSSVSSPVQGYAPSSSSRVSVLSHALHNSSDRGSPASIVFDQDECGTIKRQPLPHEVFKCQPRLHTPTSIHEDSDSDEDEQLPPPPPQEVVLQRVVLPVGHKSVGFVDEITPNRSSVPMLPAKPFSLSLAATPRKVAPPPPPKRSEITQLHNGRPGGPPTPTQPQMQLYSELQKATARQKQRIEGN